MITESVRALGLVQAKGSARFQRAAFGILPNASECLAARMRQTVCKMRTLPEDSSPLPLTVPQRIDERLHPLIHLEQLRPGPVIVFAGQFPRGVNSHMRPNILLGRGVIK
jgi:hypothetical protein